LAAFVAGFDFDGIGETIMDKVVRAGWDTLESLRRASHEDVGAVYGLGGISARTILEGLAETKDDMDAVLAAGIVSIAAPRKAEELPLRGLSFCFTGELRSMKRSSAEERVKELGGQVKGSVVKDLSYLVNNDPSSNSGKNKKARELAVPIIDEDAFLALLESAPLGDEKKGRGAGESSLGQGELF
jgi:DNA ligase (NAD+)